jgi:hypothetical protein
MDNQIYHALTDKRWHSSIADVQSFRRADCYTDHYLMVAKVSEKLSGSKQAVQKFDKERFDLKRLNDVEVKEQY